MADAPHAPEHALQTEYEFTLPCGLVGAGGAARRDGVMRLATARDELEVLRDARGRAADGGAGDPYLGVLLLSRVVTRLGDVSPVPPAAVAGLFAADYAYLQDLYMRLNDGRGIVVDTECPSCGARFALETAGGVVDA